jgi:hypothetical protein
MQWNEEGDKLLEELKQAILDAPVLMCPAPARSCLKTDWSCNAQGAVLLQAGCAGKAALKRELDGGDCKFEKTMRGLRLLPIAFISQWRPTPSSRHSLDGEKKCQPDNGKCSGRKFTWIIDCSGLMKFFETD